MLCVWCLAGQRRCWKGMAKTMMTRAPNKPELVMLPLACSRGDDDVLEHARGRPVMAGWPGALFPWAGWVMETGDPLCAPFSGGASKARLALHSRVVTSAQLHSGSPVACPSRSPPICLLTPPTTHPPPSPTSRSHCILPPRYTYTSLPPPASPLLHLDPAATLRYRHPRSHRPPAGRLC